MRKSPVEAFPVSVKLNICVYVNKISNISLLQHDGCAVYSSGFLFWVDPMALFWESSLVATLIDEDGKSLLFPRALFHVPLFLPCGNLLETFCCWTLSCSFSLSPLYLCCWQQMEQHGDRNEGEFYKAPSPFHWTLPSFSTVLLANKIIEIKFLSNESCQLPEPSCSSQAPLISLNFYHQSSFKFDIAIQEKTNHENLHVHLLHTHGKMVMKKGIYFHVLYIQSNFTSPTFQYSNSTICYN